MSHFPELLFYTLLLSGTAGLLYGVALLAVTLVSVLASAQDRRKDARTTLGILVRRRPR
ncbi:hypothetical protein [Streptomyces pacificus]|uniref:Uncharacterized protein n=1 Tax=Streptomyces pacificus TaxID=2705029 RepID=A0A6A0ASP0_9ACTN|nr:hypothetical protein [Streptomyces pacificus]GFH35916.1 hypothetical protein SCWH03_21380 [Streptomyces pacificus]